MNHSAVSGSQRTNVRGEKRSFNRAIALSASLVQYVSQHSQETNIPLLALCAELFGQL